VKSILIAAATLGFIGLSNTITLAAPHNYVQPSVQGYVHKAAYGHAYRHVRRHYRRWH
jgi:hypothetical protein